MAKLFVVCRPDGFLPVIAEAGDVITPDKLQQDIFKPSEEQLNTMSVDEIKQLYTSLGFKLRKGTRKSEFVRFVLGDWENTMAEARVRFLSPVGVPNKLMFFKSSAGFFKPFLVAGGQVFREEYFQGDMENLELTAPMLHSLTKCQLVRLYSTMEGGVLDAKYTKPEMVARVLSFWNHNITRFQESASDDAEPSAGDASPDLSEGDANSASSDLSEDATIGILDIMDFNEEDWLTTPAGKAYLNSPACFDDMLTVRVFDYVGERFLFSVVTDRDVTGQGLKRSIIDHIAFIQSTKESSDEEPILGPDDFKLSRKARFQDIQPDDELVDGNTFYICLKLRGGAPRTKKQEAKSKVKYMSVLEKKKVRDANLQNMKPCEITSTPAFVESNRIMANTWAHGEKDAVSAFQELINHLDIDQLKCAQSSIASNMGGDNNFKLGKLSEVLFGGNIDKVKDVRDVASSFMDCASLTTNALFEMAVNQDDKFDITSLRNMIDKMLVRKEGFQSGYMSAVSQSKAPLPAQDVAM
ncbi:unnamed protein product [Effrenium voratum]|uniref:Uncharacterized protein n=1 Tax=Effrenium voratum TaxID=2562239 RepID=A0AA36N0F8_9DINO|nr:unnamed protein product [Effrenium voratum]